MLFELGSLFNAYTSSSHLPPPPPPPPPPTTFLLFLLQNDFLVGGAVALGYLTLSALIISAAIGSVYFAQLSQAQDMQREVDLLQRQLGESLYIFQLVVCFLVDAVR